MTVRDWLHFFAALGHSVVGVLCLSRRRQSPLSRLLALLCLDLFGVHFATFAFHSSRAAVWDWADAVFTVLCPPLVLHFVVTFVGARHRYTRSVFACYVGFGAFALASSASFLRPRRSAWVDSASWASILLVGWLPVLAGCLSLLIRHLLATTDVVEKARTRTVLSAIALGGALGTTDLAAGAGMDIPYLGSLGTLTGALLIASAVFRLELFDDSPPKELAFYALTLTAAAGAFYSVVIVRWGGNMAAVTFGGLSLLVILSAAARESLGANLAQRERAARLTSLGRVAGQMAHDIRNPLAALLGSAQALEGDLSGEDRRALSDLVIEQAHRIRAVVESYERFGNVEPVVSRIKLNDIVERVVAGLNASANPRYAFRTELSKALPECDLDPDLVATALENLASNAVDAMPEGGTCKFATWLEYANDDELTVAISVTDTGIGMDVRRAERVFDDFFTTKSNGRGFGLAFVERVARAHRGTVSVKSSPECGTTFVLKLRGTV